MTARRKLLSWLTSDFVDDATSAELMEIMDDEHEVAQRFGSELTFETGGVRALVGAGTNRLNKYTIAKITTALARYIKRRDSELRGVVVGYDGRNDSEYFAKIVDAVLTQNGIPCFLFNTMRPTPMLAYAVRVWRAVAGVMITASHNPAGYNGYKVYWEDGGQITDEIANQIQEEYARLTDQIIAPNEALSSNQEVDAETVDRWYSGIADRIMNRGMLLSDEERRNYKVLYSPLHGVGETVVPKYLERYSFATAVTQIGIDGSFPTVPVAPNPEEETSYSHAVEFAHGLEGKPDLILLTDSDCDRVGVSALNYRTGEYVRLNGHEVGALLIDFLVRTRRNIPSNGYIAKTFVTPDLGTRIASNYGLRSVDVPTGFKYIGETIRQMKFQQGGEFFFGYEESCGYLFDDDVRDKCGIQAALLIADMGAYWKQRDARSLCEVLENIFRTYGYYAYEVMSVGIEDEYLRNISIESFRNNGIRGMELKIDGEKMLRFEDPDDSRSFIAIRVSGTEPKLKFYINARRSRAPEARARLNDMKALIIELLYERSLINGVQRNEMRSVLS